MDLENTDNDILEDSTECTNDEIFSEYPYFVSKQQMATMLQISKKQAIKLIEKWIMPSELIGHSRIIRKADIIAYLQCNPLLSDEQKKDRKNELIAFYESEFKNYPDVVNTTMLEEMLNVSNNYVLRRLQDGRIKSLMISRTRMIPKVYLIEFVSSEEYQYDKCKFPHMR